MTAKQQTLTSPQRGIALPQPSFPSTFAPFSPAKYIATGARAGARTGASRIPGRRLTLHVTTGSRRALQQLTCGSPSWNLGTLETHPTMAEGSPTDNLNDTSQIRNWRSIVTLIVFVVTSKFHAPTDAVAAAQLTSPSSQISSSCSPSTSPSMYRGPCVTPFWMRLVPCESYRQGMAALAMDPILMERPRAPVSCGSGFP